MDKKQAEMSGNSCVYQLYSKFMALKKKTAFIATQQLPKKMVKKV